MLGRVISLRSYFCPVKIFFFFFTSLANERNITQKLVLLLVYVVIALLLHSLHILSIIQWNYTKHYTMKIKIHSINMLIRNWLSKSKALFIVYITANITSCYLFLFSGKRICIGYENGNLRVVGLKEQSTLQEMNCKLKFTLIPSSNRPYFSLSLVNT